MNKPILYIDMDNVLVDFGSALTKVPSDLLEEYAERFDEIPGIFSLMDPMPGAIEAVHSLMDKFEVFILSTAPWLNPTAWSDKISWIHKHFGMDQDSPLHKKLILSHHKHLNRGDYLIDDRNENGADRFEGKLIKFGARPFKNWHLITSYLVKL
jgi:5'(3')-deoxyribonucleotidase